MGRPRKNPDSVISTEEKTNAETLEAVKVTGANFELTAEIVAGKLTSNAQELSAAIKEQLKNYSVEKYMNDPDAAKTDKAFLNKVETSVAAKRKEITAKWNEPLDQFLTEMKGLEKEIKAASDGLNAIVKEADEKEKAEKKDLIEKYFNSLNFTLVSLDRIFNPRWLLKGTKLNQVYAEIDGIVQKVTTELETIKNQPEDAEILASFYIETLDINATLLKGQQMRENRARIKAAEEAKRLEEERKQKEAEMQKEPEEPKMAKVSITTKADAERAGYGDEPAQASYEFNLSVSDENISKLVEFFKDKKINHTFVLRLNDVLPNLQAVRKFMDQEKITYTKM